MSFTCASNSFLKYFQATGSSPYLKLEVVHGGVELGGNVGGDAIQVEAARLQLAGQRGRPGGMVIAAVL